MVDDLVPVIGIVPVIVGLVPGNPDRQAPDVRLPWEPWSLRLSTSTTSSPASASPSRNRRIGETLLSSSAVSGRRLMIREHERIHHAKYRDTYALAA